MKDLKQQFENIVDQYITIFCQKQEIDKKDLYWIGGEIGDVVEISDCYFNFSDIKKDIDTNQPKGLIFDWHNENDYINDKIINYQSYIKGLRVKDLK